MQHFYHNVEGFMNHRNTVLLDHVIEHFPPGGTWVELGSWVGRSTAYSVVELYNKQKLGAFYCVDTWLGGDEHYGWQQLQNLRDRFDQAMQPIRELITPIESVSWVAAERFDHQSVDFCYVDAGHTYEAVTQDLEHWWPKLRPGSFFAGDDYTKGYPGVQRAVWEFFDKVHCKVSRMGRCWLVTKPFDM